MISRNLTRLVLGIALGLAVAGTGFAQYGGSTGMGGMGSTNHGIYTPPKGGYKSSTGIAIGAAAAAGVAVAYLFIRSRRSMVGCVEKAGTQLMNEKDKKSYALDAGTLNLKPGDRVKLKGKKTKSDSGAPGFMATKLVKDYGPCDSQAALNQVPATP